MVLWYYSPEEFLDTERAKHLFHTSMCAEVALGFSCVPHVTSYTDATSADASKMKPVRTIHTKLMTIKISW